MKVNGKIDKFLTNLEKRLLFKITSLIIKKVFPHF